MREVVNRPPEPKPPDNPADNLASEEVTFANAALARAAAEVFGASRP